MKSETVVSDASDALESAWSHCTDANRLVGERDGKLPVLEQLQEKPRAPKQVMVQELPTGRTRLV